MEAKINIVEILKDKPQGTKLYSSACGKCKLEEVDDKSFKISFYNSKFGFMNGGEGYLDKNGKLYDDGECVVFPSKEMRDWTKFSWKKGDVLVNSRGLKILFDRWANDNYTSFYAKTINLVEDAFLDTNLHTLASEKEAKSFIKCIEEKLGGKLNLETLEIEKQHEFKDGDIVVVDKNEEMNLAKIIAIYNDGDTLLGFNSYAYLNVSLEKLNFCSEVLACGRTPRLASEEEKQQLFDALAKEGKRWNPDTKLFEDLPKKCEFKPFDKVLVRDSGDEEWKADFFSHNRFVDVLYYRFSCVGNMWRHCIPYNEETKHLLGTTDEWKG